MFASTIAFAQPTNCTGELLGSFGGGAHGFASSGDGRVYLALGSGGLMVVDASDPSNPVSIGQISTDDFAEDVEVRNDYTTPHSTQGEFDPVRDRREQSGELRLEVVQIPAR
ncbi:MAG: hypothetical protein R3B67_07095 [Phycisphaerales bacterium]